MDRFVFSILDTKIFTQALRAGEIEAVDQAIEILGHKDVSITNQSEKDPMLRRLKEFEQRVMQIESDWVPVEFRDSITNGFMEDPVIAEDGRTYSRESIIGWIESCKAKGEPVTS